MEKLLARGMEPGSAERPASQTFTVVDT